MNDAIVLLLAFIALGVMRLRWERQSAVAMVLVVAAYITYAYYNG